LSQIEQWEARGGRNILHVKQYFNFIVTPLISISFILGGGRYPLNFEIARSSSKYCFSICFACSLDALGITPGSEKAVRNHIERTKP
jgi:hypothetical protein